MATYNSTQYDKIVNVGRDGVQLSTVELGGNVHCSTFRFVLTAALLAGDVIRLTQIPDGAVLLSAYATQEGAEDLNFQMDFGTSASTQIFNAYSGATVFSDAGINALGQNRALHQTDGEEILQITVGTVSNGGVAGKIIRGYVVYSV